MPARREKLVTGREKGKKRILLLVRALRGPFRREVERPENLRASQGGPKREKRLQPPGKRDGKVLHEPLLKTRKKGRLAPVRRV